MVPVGGGTHQASLLIFTSICNYVLFEGVNIIKTLSYILSYTRTQSETI